MNCPTCTNQAKKTTRFYYEPAFMEFTCQYCNTPLRGNFVMILLEFVGMALLGSYVGVYLAFFESIKSFFDENNAGLLFVTGIVLIVVPVKMLQERLGRFVALRKPL